MVAWRSFFIYFGERGGVEALSVGGVQFELVWASEGTVTAKRCQKITVQKSFLGWRNDIV
jgi:hypothetical protein